MDDPVGLGGRSHVLLLGAARELEGELQDTIDALAGEDRLLDRELVLRALEHAAAELAVLAFGILALHPEIDLAGLAVGERRRHALEQAHRPKVHVFVEVAANGDQQSPQRHMVGHARPADCPEENAFELLELLHAIVRHHLAGGQEAIARPVELGEFELEIEAPRGGFEDAHALRQNFLADSVPRNERDLVLGHSLPPETRADPRPGGRAGATQA